MKVRQENFGLDTILEFCQISVSNGLTTMVETFNKMVETTNNFKRAIKRVKRVERMEDEVNPPNKYKYNDEKPQGQQLVFCKRAYCVLKQGK